MDFSYDKQMGSRIRLLREARHLTQEQLAAKLQVQGCDITRSALAKIEVGQRHLYAREIKLLHEILQVPYDQLFV
jgi:transcriptional regulator with XRE-family HTH domain